MKYHAILLFGAPGSGKGTQGAVLGQIPGFVHVATGEIFRDLRVGSPLGRIFLDYSSKGQLVPDDFTVELWRDHVEGLVQTHRFEPKCDTLVLDGIPRSVAQAKLLGDTVDVKRIYYLDCHDKNIMFKRLKRRALHENRLDDANDAVIEERLRVYEAETAPVLEYYPKELVQLIDTGRAPVAVLADILADMKNHAAKAPFAELEEQHELTEVGA